MATVYVEARPKGRPEGSRIDDYVVETQGDEVLGTFTTQKAAIDWAKANPAFTALYKQLGALRSHNAALREGRMAWVPNNMPSQVLTYTKTAKDTEFLVEINLSKDVAKGTVSIPAGAAWTDVTPRGPWPAPVRTESGGFFLQPKGFAIYRRTRD